MFLAYSQSVNVYSQCSMCTDNGQSMFISNQVQFFSNSHLQPQAPICACGSTTVVLSPSALVLRAVELGVPALSLGPGAAFLSTYAREQV